MAGRPRVVLDSVIFMRALINPQGLCGRIVFDRFHEYELILSEDVVCEILEVIDRRELRQKYTAAARFNLSMVRAFISRAAIVAVAEVAAISRDVNDDKFLAAADAGNADMLVTEVQDLLVIGEHGAVSIMNAAMFIRVLNARNRGSESRR